jgi:hypothetical protein
VGTVGKQAIEAVKTVKDVKTGAHIVKSGLQTVALVGSGVAGGAIANAISGEVVDPQQLLEGIHKTVVEAKAHGINMREVVSPNLIFMLRVSQDEQFAKAIKEQYKKPFQRSLCGGEWNFTGARIGCKQA